MSDNGRCEDEESSGVPLVWINDEVGYRCPECYLYVCIPRRDGATCPRCTAELTPEQQASAELARVAFRDPATRATFKSMAEETANRTPVRDEPFADPRPTWHVGDRVELAPCGYTASGRPRCGIARGTVEAVDDGGVHIRFDGLHNGAMTCYASPRELTRVE